MHILYTMILRRWKIFWPIGLSALSFFTAFLIVQPIAVALDPSFSLFASKGLGKIGLTVMVIMQTWLLVFLRQTFMPVFVKTNFSFFFTKTWLNDFFKYFFLFFFLHLLFLSLFFITNEAYYNVGWWVNINPTIVFSLLFGLIATFFLAWTEELIFRGTLYQFFAQEFCPITSALIASLIFMAAHDFHNPLNLITTNWRLGLGLFLLGFFLNLIFIITKKLYTGMGIHAGLVFVKVIMRRIQFLTFLPTINASWWLDKDLRQSPVVHLIFLITIITMVIWKRKILFKNNQ